MFEIKVATIEQNQRVSERFHKLWITSSVEELDPIRKDVINSQQAEIF